MVNRSFDDLLVPATKLVNIHDLRALEPWHLQESLRTYEPSYLAGFEAQRAQVSLKEGFEEAKGMMRSEIESAVRSNIGEDEQRINSVATDYYSTFDDCEVHQGGQDAQRQLLQRGEPAQRTGSPTRVLLTFVPHLPEICCMMLLLNIFSCQCG